MNKVLKVLNKSLNIMVVITVATMCLLVFMNVVLRYAFNTGLTWSEELARYLFVWTIFLGAVVAAKDKAHIGVDVLVSALPRKLQKVAYLLAQIVVIVVLGLITDGLIKMMVLNSGISGPATGLPVGLLYLAGLVFAVCMIGISIVQCINFVFLNKDDPSWAKADIDPKVKGGAG